MVEKLDTFTPARISPAELEARRTRGPSATAGGSGSFADTLQAAVGEPLRFSAHAEERLRSRDIHLTEQDSAQLTQAVAMAQKKGAQESLILYDDLALIVSIRNKVVITALERGGQEANVFTHIDSAVVIPGNRS